MATSLPQRVARGIRRRHLLTPGSRVAIAVSGGADSVALLFLLADLADELGLSLAVAHFNHQLRPESGADSAFVAALAGRLGLRYYQAGADHAEARRENVEQGARRARYAFLAKLVADGEVTQVATAHTADDQAETVLLRLLRGSGPAGMAGIWPSHGGSRNRPPWLVRPLLEFSRAEVRAWLRARGETWREDASNADLDRARNRLRHQILPLLAETHPGVHRNLSRLAEIARAEELYWRALVRRRSDVHWRLVDGAWEADCARLRRLPLGLRRRMVREGLRRALGHLRRVGFEHVEKLTAWVSEPEQVPAGAAGLTRHLQIAGLDCECTPTRLALRPVRAQTIRQDS